MADFASWTTYFGSSPARDEMVLPSGQERPHWALLAEALRRMGGSALADREREIAEKLRRSGATYRSVIDGKSASRPWSLDVLPVLLTSEEWAVLERGILQRAELLDLILADFYGPRKLIAEGKVPPELLYRNPAYLRPCAGTLPPGKRKWIHGAVDLARRGDGGWTVLSDRTQNPSGVGYALENRIVLSQTLPSLYRESQVHRLAPFFRALRQTLRSLAPHPATARIVVLSAGPKSETYFEHAFLANYLGYPLVEGNELVVQGGRVHFRSLSGLSPVDVILRRLDEDYADPLELRSDSLLGTPGLLQAVREGNVAIANPLGSGVLESRALSTLLPGLCRHLLGEDLLLPSAEGFWCAEPGAIDRLRSEFSDLVFKSAFRAGGTPSLFGSELSRGDREELIRRIEADPSAWVAQKRIQLSTVPAHENGALVPRSMNLRAFLCARDDQYLVMPGGLTRIAADAGSLLVSNQAGGTSKDTWILSSEPQSQESLLSGYVHTMVSRSSADELSGRVAENLYWAGRYVSRVDLTARLFREIMARLVENRELGRDPSLAALWGSLGRQTFTFPGFLAQGSDPLDLERELFDLAGNPNRTGGLAFHLARLGEAGLNVRDRLPEDLWRVIRSMGEVEVRSLDDLSSLSDRVIQKAAACRSFAREGLSTHDGTGKTWRYFDFGRRLEWTQGLSIVIAHLFENDPHASESLWRAALALTDNLLRFQSQPSAVFRREAAFELIALDESNPASISRHLATLENHLIRLLGERDARRATELRLLLQARQSLRLHDPSPASQASVAVLRQCASDLSEVSQLLEVRTFQQVEWPRNMGN